MTIPNDWGVKPFGFKPEERRAIEEWEKEESKQIKIKPNLTGNEAIKKVRAEESMDTPYSPDRYKRIVKGDWGYMVDESGEVTAVYLPSMKEELTIMYEWKNNKWKLMMHMKGTW